MPFDLLVEHLNPDRSLAHHPLFQVMLTVQQQACFDTCLGDLPARLQPAVLDSAKFDLSVFCTELDGGGIEIWLQYATDLFDEGTAVLLRDGYLRVLHAVAADPAVRVGALEVLSDEQRAALARRRG